MNGLSHINIELTSRCNKTCHMCGRRKTEKEYPELANWGDMPIDMVKAISYQVPPGIFVQFHWNGEPLLYPHLREAFDMFHHCYTGLDTNGKLLMAKASALELIHTVTISVIPQDPEAYEQIEIASEFLAKKGEKYPKIVVFRLLGHPDSTEKWQKLAKKYGCIVAHRVLHDPMGSFDYKKPVTIPEHGVCLEMIHKLSIDREGNVSPCVRYDPEGYNIIGSIEDYTLDEIWNSTKRRCWIKHHMLGSRESVPLCETCDFWGVPRG